MQKLHVRVKDEYKDPILYLSQLHDRSAAAEVNHALRQYIGAHKPDLDKIRATDPQPQREES